MSKLTILRRGFTILVRDEEGGGSSSPVADQGAAVAANATGQAGQAMGDPFQASGDYDVLCARNFDVVLVVLVGLFFLFLAPEIASWFSSGRLTRGWFLRLGSGVNSDEEQGEHGVVSRPNGVAPQLQRPSVLSGWYANWRWAFNKILLPPIAFVGLTVGQVLVCVGYQAIVFFFLLFQSGSLTNNFSRPGYIAVAQIPPVFLLATKKSLISILGKGYEKLNFLHRVAGYMMVLCSALHTIFFVKGSFENAESIDFTDPTILTGTIAMVSLGLILLTSVSFFRRAFYQVFVFSHIIGWLSFIVALNLHIPDALIYTYIGVGGLLLDFIVRAARTRFKTATLTPLPGGMTKVEVHGVAEGWRAGQHVWLRVLKGRRAGECHPFTVANAPASASSLPGQHNLTILAKSTGDWTRALMSMASSTPANGENEKDSFGAGRKLRVAIEGPYGGPMFTDFSNSQIVLLFAGGSGITFAASVLEEIVGHASTKTCRTRSVTLIWTMETLECVSWYKDMFNGLLAHTKSHTALNVFIKIYVTGLDQTQLCPVPLASVFAARPDVASLVQEAVEDVIAGLPSEFERGGGVAVGTCGPAPLVKAVRAAVGGVKRAKAVKAGGIVAHGEAFGW